MVAQVVEREEKFALFSAFAHQANLKGLELTTVGSLDVGDDCVYVAPCKNDIWAIVAARAGWHSRERTRVMTDVTAFIWCGHEVNAEDSAMCTDQHWEHEQQACIRFSNAARARAFAAIVSENGDFDRAEDMYSA